MVSFLKEKRFLLLALAVLPFFDLIFSPLATGFLLLLIIQAYRQESTENIFILFWVTLIYSDNFYIEFASFFKPIFVIIVFSYAVLLLKKMDSFKSLAKYFLVFFIIAFVALLFSPIIFKGFQKYLSFVLMYLSIPILTIKMLQEDKLKSLKYFSYVGFLVLVECIIQYLFFSYAVSHGGRLHGVFGNPNGLGMFCLFLVLLIEIVRYYDTSWLSKKQHWLFIGFILVVILLSGSRASLLSVIIFYVFARLTKISPLVSFVFVSLLAAFYDSVLVLGIDFLQTLNLKAQFRITDDNESIASGRLVAWRFAWEEIQNSFFIGKGWNYDEHWVYGPISALLSSLNHQGGVHNTYLILWLNNGIIGLTAFIGGLISLVLSISQRVKIIFPVLYAGLFQAYFEPWLAGSLNPYTIIFLVILTITLNYSSEEFKTISVSNESLEEQAA